MTYRIPVYGNRIPVYGRTSGKTVPAAEVSFPITVFLRNFARVEGQQDHKDWRKKISKKRTL